LGRYTHAHWFERARQLKFLRTGLAASPVTSDAKSRAILDDCLGPLLDLAHRVRRQRGPKVYSMHAPEWSASAKATPGHLTSLAAKCHACHTPKGRQFVLHAKALHSNPYDGHALGPIIADLEKLTGVAARRIHSDKGYRGHNYSRRFKGLDQVGGCHQSHPPRDAASRRRRVIGHRKEDHRTRHNGGRDGDRINAVQLQPALPQFNELYASRSPPSVPHLA
jgi:transposase, IS5 family